MTHDENLYRRLAECEEPWTAYGAAVDLCGQQEDRPDVKARKGRMLEHPLVAGLIEELKGWPCEVLSSHKSASQPFHKLAFLADIGLKASDPGISVILERVMSHASDEGIFLLPMRISEAHRGSGEQTWAWAACDAPVILYALAKMGLANDPTVIRGVDHLLGLARDNGWGCAVSRELGSFRGPGRKSDPCPYVNLIMLKLITLYSERMDGPEAAAGVECLLSLWERSLSEHPYIFYMGNDFRKLKAPLVWYDLLHALEALSRYPRTHADPRFKDMLALANGKACDGGMFTPESVWQAWKGWDFGQKKVPSSWLTLMMARINRRASGGTT